MNNVENQEIIIQSQGLVTRFDFTLDDQSLLFILLSVVYVDLVMHNTIKNSFLFHFGVISQVLNNLYMSFDD